MKRKIKKLKAIALSDSDVMKLVEHKARVLTYGMLREYSTLDEVLGKHNAIFLLYETKPDYGHWTAVFRRTDENGQLTNTIEFFDPYGIFPDNELEWVPDNFKEISGQNYPMLSALLYESPYNLTYNDHKFQKHGEGINTCGRWSALRIVFKDIPLEMFADKFLHKNGEWTSDEIVSILTSQDLK